MFSDPQTLTVNVTGKSLVRINQDQYSSEYLLRSATNEFRLKIRNSTYRDKARNVLIDRHNVEFTEVVFPVAPATLSTVRKTYFVVENQQGDTLTDPTYDAAALFNWAIASTNANITKLLNFES
jgi:hypothetical protein